MAFIGHMLRKAVEWGMLEASPFKKGKRLMFKENNQRLRFLTEAEIEALLTASDDLKAHSPYLRPMVETALLTGMRRGELLSLKWEQIRNGFIYLTETKSGKGRQIPINDRLAEVFKEVRRGNQLKSDLCVLRFPGAALLCGEAFFYLSLPAGRDQKISGFTICSTPLLPIS